SILRHTPETALLHHATHPWPDMNGATADPANYGLSEIVKTGSNYFFSKSPVATIRIANHFRPANATLAVICRIDRASQSIPAPENPLTGHFYGDFPSGRTNARES